MQIGNPQKLAAERAAILNAFDAAWMTQTDDPIPMRARRAIRCARRLAACDGPAGQYGARTIYPCFTITAPRVILA